VTDLSDRELQALLAEDPGRGWRAFIDRHTTALLLLIGRVGVSDADETMELYLRVCEHLHEGGCARLRRHDPAQGSLRAWLAVVVRNVAVDWVRSRAGRRRLFAAVKHLPALEREVFELYYWERRMPSEIVEVLSARGGRPLGLTHVLDALDRVQASLTDRHRAQLLPGILRGPRAGTEDDEPPEAPDPRPDPENALRMKDTDALFAAALSRLTAEEAAIIRLKFVQGLSHRQIQQALHLPQLTDDRVKGIMARLRAHLAGQPLAAGDAAPGLAFLEEPE
jgi:DNA-directed RNA polymerase specialized sigma24 family protein